MLYLIRIEDLKPLNTSRVCQVVIQQPFETTWTSLESDCTHYYAYEANNAWAWCINKIPTTTMNFSNLNIFWCKACKVNICMLHKALEELFYFNHNLALRSLHDVSIVSWSYAVNHTILNITKNESKAVQTRMVFCCYTMNMNGRRKTWIWLKLLEVCTDIAENILLKNHLVAFKNFCNLVLCFVLQVL